VDLGFQIAQADVKKLDQEVSGHLRNLESKRVESENKNQNKNNVGDFYRFIVFF